MSDQTEPGTAPERLPEHATALPLRLRDNVWVWASAGTIVLSCLVAAGLGAAVGAYVLAGLLAVCGFARLLGPEPGRPGLAIRSRRLDVLGFWSFAVGIAVLAATAPMI